MTAQSGLEETRNTIRLTTTLALGVTNGSIIDFETTGRPGVDKEHEVITLGCVEGNRTLIIQRASKEKLQFYSEVRKILEDLPRPYLAYNADFEKQIMGIELAMSLGPQDFVDIMEPWRAKAKKRCIKWPRLDELISEPYEYFGEPVISGKEIPTIWKDYLATLDDRYLRLIVNHCLSDVSREAILHSVYENQIPSHSLCRALDSARAQ